MSDWDFLHNMHNEGYSPNQIADAAACGYNPDEIFDFSDLGHLSDEWQAIDDDLLPSAQSIVDPELVKIGKDFTFEGKFIARKNLSKGKGVHAKVLW